MKILRETQIHFIGWVRPLSRWSSWFHYGRSRYSSKYDYIQIRLLTAGFDVLYPV